MTNTKRTIFLFFTSIVLPCTIFAQQKSVELGRAFEESPNFFLSKWDPLQDRLILYRSRWSEISPAIHVFSPDGRTRLLLSPLAGLPDYQYISTMDVAAAPEGGIAIAATLKDAAKHLTDTVLLYDSDGKLSQMWQIAPYHHHAIAVGPDGSVYGFGDRSDLDSTGGVEKHSPLLVHYSKQGKVLQSGLTLDLFPKGLEIVDSGPLSGEHHMFFSSGKLVLYVATTTEVFLFDPELRLIQRIPLSQKIADAVKSAGLSDGQIRRVTFEGNTLILQVMMWSEKRPPITKLLTLDPRTSSCHVVDGNFGDAGRLMQATVQDALFLHVKNDESLALQSYSLPR